MIIVDKKTLLSAICHSSFTEFPVEYEIELLKLKDPELAYYYVLFHSDSFVFASEMKSWENIVLNSKNSKWNYLFALDIKGADIALHEKVILENKELEWNCQFIRNFKTANVKDHVLVMLGDSFYSKMNFVKFFGAEDKADVWSIVEPYVLEQNDSILSYLVAKEIKKANIKDHEDVVYDSGNLELIYKFSRDVIGANRRRLAFPIILSKDPELNYLFARDVSDIDIFPHEKVVLDSRNPEWNMKFVRDVKGANIRSHKKVLADMEDNLIELIDQKHEEKAKVKVLMS